MLEQIYQELIAIRKELQAIRCCKGFNVKCTIDGKENAKERKQYHKASSGMREVIKD